MSSAPETAIDAASHPPVASNNTVYEQDGKIIIADTSQVDKWFYPAAIANDLSSVPLSTQFKAETLASAWEYTRTVIPHFTNWPRYLAFVRIIVISVIAEVRGSLIDVFNIGDMLGYNLQSLLDTVFHGTTAYAAICREYRAFLLVTVEKSNSKPSSELFRRYVTALVKSPRQYFRLRDCDALARFAMAAALAVNDHDDVWFSEDELEILSELCDTMYDGVAYYKHRAEGEVNSTFAYVGADMRTETYRRHREVLWALDVAWADKPAYRCILNFLRAFGGPLHMTMRRYRFVEDGLMIGREETDTETEELITQARANFKLWNRIEASETVETRGYYERVIACRDELMFDGLAEMLQSANRGNCKYCHYRAVYGADTSGSFGGVVLCDGCRYGWKQHIESFPERAGKVFAMSLPS